jgi:hypothetical protein
MSTEIERSPDIGFARPRTVKVDDEPFQASLADLARQLAQRVPHEPPPVDAGSEAELPPEPVEPTRKYRRHSPYLGVLALAVGVALAAIIHGLIGAPSEPAQPPPQTPVAVAPPLPDPVPPPSESDIAPNAMAKVDPPPPPRPAPPMAATPPVAATPPEPAPPRPSKAKLEGYEIMEIQTRLKAAGIDPGPLDGLAGAQTAAAIKQYEASKGQPQNGAPDRDLLRQLRREVSPQQ